MEKIKAAIQSLRALERDHLSIGNEILKAANGNVYPMDLLAVAVLNRSIALLIGFCDLLESRNFIAGAPLLRLQLDNLLRFHAAWLVAKPHDFATDILRGKRVRGIKDRDGHKMTDSYLVSKIAIEYPVLKSVYEHTSGYVHLSDKHFFNAMQVDKQKARQMNIKIGAVDDFVPEAAYLEALRAFFEVTGILFRYMSGWAVTKANPPPHAPPLG